MSLNSDGNLGNRRASDDARLGTLVHLISRRRLRSYPPLELEQMITRAQAEALLTLAEALEACGEVDVHIAVPGRNETVLTIVDDEHNLDLCGGYLSPTQLRLAVNALVPKHTGS